MNAFEEENDIPETAQTSELASDEPAEPVDDSELSVEPDSEALLAGSEAALAGGEATLAVGAAGPDGEKLTRKKLEEQLEALKRKEVELRRALVMADHPELADSIRILQGRTYALERIEAKLTVGLSKAELRRRETLQKKHASLTDKRAELDAQIGEVESELNGLGVERQQGYEAERKQGLEELLVALGTHDPALHAAGIEATELVPEIGRWLPEIETLAESLASKRTRAN